MKIALVSAYDFAYPGGVNNHISSLERYITRMGHTVKVIAPASKAVSAFGDRFIPIGRPLPVPSGGSIARCPVLPTLSRKVKAVLEEEKFDIIHLHEPLCPMLCTTVLRFSKTVNVGTFHRFGGKPGYNFTKPFAFIFFKKWFRKLDGKIAVSKPAMEWVHNHFPGHFEIIPNGIDLEHFSFDVSPMDEFCDGKLNILFVGRMEKRKGFPYLLEAYRQIKREVPNCRLIVVGSGTRLRHKYEKRVRRAGLEDVVFAGYASYDELPRYYKTADVFCAPATGRESFGIVLLEAMAMGKPVVASNIEGYAGVITRGADGLLVPPKDDRMLAQAIISLLTDESYRQQMGNKGRVKAEEYSWEHIGQRILDYYAKVLNDSPRGQRDPEREESSLSV